MYLPLETIVQSPARTGLPMSALTLIDFPGAILKDIVSTLSLLSQNLRY